MRDRSSPSNPAAIGCAGGLVFSHGTVLLGRRGPDSATYPKVWAVRKAGRLLRTVMLVLALAGKSYGATAENSSPLREAASPYLRAHADDPVDWHVWGTRAFAEARTANKLVLLSIGYSACHWCHVMARESFRDAVTAKLLNERFVSILVDREAQPDIDALYQQAAATMNLPTGWPLNLILLPNGTPIDGGTYFPPERRQGMPGFTEFLDAVWQAYQENPGGLALRGTAVARALAGGMAGTAGEISRAAIDGAVRRLLDQVDSFHGGFGHAPKFPYPSALQALWRAYLRSGDAEFRDGVLLSLRSMAQGGLYDHLGGGFARYATDPAWNIPHFEKMLDLNAQLLALLVEAWRETREPLFAARIRETVRFLLHEMRLPDGAFGAAIDSDSEGREGAFYVWTLREIDDSLGADAPLFKQAYGVTDEGNWEGVNVLTRNHVSLDELSRETGLDGREITRRLAGARQTLAMTRDRRPRPLRDDKALADWNGLAIAALAEAGAAFGEPEWINAARAAFTAVERMAGDGPGLRHFQYAGMPGPPAMLDDYIHMARAALTLFEITGEPRYLSLARAWGEATDVFHDEREGGFFQTAPGPGAGNMPRFKPWLDEQMPSGNAAAAELMARLYFLTGDDDYRQRSEDTIRVYFGEATKEPLHHGAMLVATDTLLGAIQIVIAGRREEPITGRLLSGVWETSLPGRVLQVIAPGHSLPEGHPAKGKGQTDGRPTAYVCKGTFCSLPVTGVAELVATLEDIRKGRVQRSSDADRTEQR